MQPKRSVNGRTAHVHYSAQLIGFMGDVVAMCLMVVCEQLCDEKFRDSAMRPIGNDRTAKIL